jgi:hypothetical protein
MSKLVRSIFAATLLLSSTTLAQARTLSVDCSAKEGLNSIAAALRVLEASQSAESDTIEVTGACRENVLIQNMDRLTLKAVGAASITDVSDGNREVIDVASSSGVIIRGFTITSTCPASCMNGPGADGIDCYLGSECLLVDNTISGAGNGAGIGVYPLSKVIVEGGVSHHNQFGLFTNDSGAMFVLGVTVRDNVYGVYLNNGGSVSIRVGLDGATPSVIAHNTQQGVFTSLGGAVSVHAPAEIANNGAEGIYLALGSKLFVGGGTGGSARISITGNVGSGVSVNDVSIASFAGTARVTGNGAPDIACNAPTALTVGAIAAAGGIKGLPYTNCAN